MSAHEPVHHAPVPLRARSFQGTRAGVVTRSVAGAVDYLLVTLAVLGTYFGIAVLLFLLDPRNYQWPRWSLLTFLTVGWTYLFGYLTVGWATTGRTFGAQLLGLRVVNFRGRRMRLPGAALRALCCVVFPVGLFWCAVNRSNRSVQDVLLRTSVIHDWSSQAPTDDTAPASP